MLDVEPIVSLHLVGTIGNRGDDDAAGDHLRGVMFGGRNRRRVWRSQTSVTCKDSHCRATCRRGKPRGGRGWQCSASRFIVQLGDPGLRSFNRIGECGPRICACRLACALACPPDGLSFRQKVGKKSNSIMMFLMVEQNPDEVDRKNTSVRNGSDSSDSSNRLQISIVDWLSSMSKELDWH